MLPAKIVVRSTPLSSKIARDATRVAYNCFKKHFPFVSHVPQAA